MKTLLLCFSIALGMAHASFAQNASIFGRVLDGAEPAIAATVRLERQGITLQGCNTNEIGVFRFENLNAGDYQLIVSYNTYQDSLPVSGIRANETRDMGDIVMQIKSIDVDIIDHYGLSFYPMLDWTGSPSGSFYNREQIRNNPAR